MCLKRWSAAFVVAFFLLLTAGAQAQWILAAHAAKNQINRMTQHSANGGYDVATVVLDANPSNVYDKTLERLKARTDLKITKQDKDMGTIEIKKGRGTRLSDLCAGTERDADDRGVRIQQIK